MTVQVFYSADSLTSFPSLEAAGGGGTPFDFISRLFWSDGAQMMIALFEKGADSNDDAGINRRGTIQRIWRDGTLVEPLPQVPKSRIPFFDTATVVPTNDGRVGRAIFAGLGYTGAFGDYWAPILNEDAFGSATGTAYWEVNPLWPGDLLTGQRLAEASHMHFDAFDAATGERDNLGIIDPANRVSGGNGMLLPTQSAVYAVFTNHHGVPGQHRVIYKDDLQSTIAVSWFEPPFSDEYVNQFRQLIPVDASTVIALFRPEGTPPDLDETKPAQIRVFDRNTLPWVELWRDLLPGVDQVATFDPANRVLYSMGKRATNAALHASLLYRTPSVTSASIVGTETVLPGPGRISLSALVLDGQGLPISNELVHWGLAPVASGGRLVSNYSLTNPSGQASISYLGPFRPSALTESVTTTVAQVRKT